MLLLLMWLVLAIAVIVGMAAKWRASLKELWSADELIKEMHARLQTEFHEAGKLRETIERYSTSSATHLEALARANERTREAEVKVTALQTMVANAEKVSLHWMTRFDAEQKARDEATEGLLMLERYRHWMTQRPEA